LAASLRFHRDNPPKKKTIRNPHADPTDPKKRTLKDSMYHKKIKDFSELMKKAPKGAPRKPRAKRPDVSTRRTRPTPRNK